MSNEKEAIKIDAEQYKRFIAWQHGVRVKEGGARRHLVEAKTADKYNYELAASIERMLVPTGYQENKRYGHVSGQQYITKRTVDDLTYQMILEVAKQKVYTLVYVVAQIRAADKEVFRLADEINTLSTSRFMRFLKGERKQFKHLEDLKAQQIIRLGILHGFRAHIEKHGPMIPEEVKKQNGLL